MDAFSVSIWSPKYGACKSDPYGSLTEYSSVHYTIIGCRQLSTMHYWPQCSIQYSTVQHSTVQYSTVQYITLHSAVQYTMHHNTRLSIIIETVSDCRCFPFPWVSIIVIWQANSRIRTYIHLLVHGIRVILSRYVDDVSRLTEAL